MAEFTNKLKFLDLSEVDTVYEDKEYRNVCGGCGSYYVVTPEELEEIQKIVAEMYEACRLALLLSKQPILQGNADTLKQALALADGKEIKK